MINDAMSQRLRHVFDLQRANRWRMAQTTAPERIARLVRLREAIWAQRDGIHQAIFEDYRKNALETDITEVFPILAEINHTVNHLRKWMKPVRTGAPLALFSTKNEVRYEPRGLVLVLAPWNYPISLLINPLVAAISAGNCVIAKPSSKVPATARFLAKFLGGIFQENEVAVFEGSTEVAEALLELPFDHIFFTGSPRVGTRVMAAAAKHLASVTLELGGKSPVIADHSADPKKLAERVLWGKFINAGQTCMAPDYLLLHESLLPRFLDEARMILNRRYGDTEEARKVSADYCRLVSESHLLGLRRVLDASLAAGARLEIGGISDQVQRYLSPTILTGVSADSPIMDEEIFGPILPVITFSSLDEAIGIVQAKDKPLALYIFSSDTAAVERILANTSAGGTCVNGVVVHVGNPDLPFGGIGKSGLGNYHGFFGFRSLSHERAVMRTGWLNTVRIGYPPYTTLAKKMVRFMMKHLS